VCDSWLTMSLIKDIGRYAGMATEAISINMRVNWRRPKEKSGAPYKWGDRKSPGSDPSWAVSDVIYRWVRSSAGEIAAIGETDRSLGASVNNYTSARPDGRAGSTKQRVFAEHQRLQEQGEHLYLEFTDGIPGYDFTSGRQRRAAEGLLVGYHKPYLPWG